MPKEARTMTMLFIARCLIVFAPKASGVVNGTFADLREIPYAVGFSHYRQATDKWTVVCAGFVIDKWWVVTAAHCCDYCIMDNFEDCKMDEPSATRNAADALQALRLHKPENELNKLQDIYNSLRIPNV